MTNRELIERLLFLAQTAVDQALDLNYDDPEDYFIYRELRELKAAALAQPEPEQEDIHYAWELQDANGEWQAGGSANSLDDVQREGNRYLQTYMKDGPHKLIIQRHCVTTIEPEVE